MPQYSIMYTHGCTHVNIFGLTMSGVQDVWSALWPQAPPKSRLGFEFRSFQLCSMPFNAISRDPGVTVPCAGAHVSHQDDCAWLQRYESWSNLSAAGERSRWPVACLEQLSAQPSPTAENRGLFDVSSKRIESAQRKWSAPHRMILNIKVWEPDELVLVERSSFGISFVNKASLCCYELRLTKRPSHTTSLSCWKTTAPMWKTWRCSHVECISSSSSSSTILLPRSCRLMWTQWMDVW